MSHLASLSSTVKLSSGYDMPIVGLGVFRNQSAVPACEFALKFGYRHIDTAQVYRNEADVGKARNSSGIPREDIFVTTKIIIQEHQSYAESLNVVEASLSKLGSSYADLYLIHSPHCGKAKRLETYRALLQKRDEGKIRSVGVSNYNLRHLEEIKSAGFEMPAVNQIELHPLCQQKPIVEYCKEHNIVVQAYCPIIKGDFRNLVIQEVAKANGKTPAQILVRWSLQRGFVPLPKSEKEDRIKENATVFDFELSSADMAKLNALDKGDAGAVSWNPVNVP